jgi:hypothetical protein
MFSGATCSATGSVMTDASARWQLQLPTPGQQSWCSAAGWQWAQAV